MKQYYHPKHSAMSTPVSSGQVQFNEEQYYQRVYSGSSATQCSGYGSSGTSVPPYSSSPLTSQYSSPSTSAFYYGGGSATPSLQHPGEPSSRPATYSTSYTNQYPSAYTTSSATIPPTNNSNLQGYTYIPQLTTNTSSHYAVDSGGVVACACGKTFTGAAKNANANRKRHIQTKADGPVYACRNAEKGCGYVANRKDNVTAHYQRSCRYNGDAT